MRAWTLGMFVPKDSEDKQLVSSIRKLLVMPYEPAEPGEATPLGLRVPDSSGGVPVTRRPSEKNLTPLSDAEYLAMFDDLVVRYKTLKTAYDRGMVVAETAEQEHQLSELHGLLDD